MIWARMLAYITGTVDEELLLRNEYLAAENRILRAQIKGELGGSVMFLAIPPQPPTPVKGKQEEPHSGATPTPNN